MQVKKGGWYKRRDGEIVGPAKRSDAQRYPWLVGGQLYTEIGGFHVDGVKDRRDLICEVPPPMDGYRPTGEFREPDGEPYYSRSDDGWKLMPAGWATDVRSDNGKRWIAEKISDEAEELTEADVESDGWIDWPGGKCPVELHTVVQVRLRSNARVLKKAIHCDWRHGNHEYDVVAYREVPADQPEKIETTPFPPSVNENPVTIEQLVQAADEPQNTIAEDIVDGLRELKDALSQPAETTNQKTIRRLRQVTEDLEAEPEKQPQPGWVINQFNDISWRTIGPDGIVILNEDGDSFEGFNVEDIEYAWKDAPDCDGFRWSPPPEETPAEQRLREVGVELRQDGCSYGIGPTDRRDIDGVIWSRDQLEAIAAHMREQEGGGSDE